MSIGLTFQTGGNELKLALDGKAILPMKVWLNFGN